MTQHKDPQQGMAQVIGWGLVIMAVLALGGGDLLDAAREKIDQAIERVQDGSRP